VVKRVLHIPFTWFPEACGGTEIYVRGLIRELAAHGWGNQVAVPAAVARVEVLDGVTVHRIQMAAALSQEMLYGAGDPLSAQGFAAVLDAEKPTVVHFHAFSPAISVLWLEAARSRGIPCVYTYHTPTLACMRGTLMRWGHVPCDGEMKALRCAACYLHGLGLPQPLAWSMAVLSPALQSLGSRVPFRSLPLTRMRHEAARHWLDGMNCIVVLCQWGWELMNRNTIPVEKLSVLRHGLAVESSRINSSARSPDGSEGDAVKLAFFGRLDRTKGLHVLMAALERQPDLKLELHGYVIADHSARASMRDVFARLEADVRVKLHPPVSPDQVVSVMAGYDAVVVPSVWLETGPLVVLEAFAAGVPVLGSDLGGIPEWVTHEQDGLLVRAGDPDAWAQALSRFTHDPALRSRLHAGVKAPPTMADVAVKMEEIYREVLS